MMNVSRERAAGLAVAAIAVVILVAIGHDGSHSAREKAPSIVVVPGKEAAAAGKSLGQAAFSASPAAPEPAAVADAPAPPDAGGDPLVDGVIEADSGIPGGRDPATLYRRVRSEPRDAAWASHSETALQKALLDVPYLKQPPRVICGSTMCEIAGAIATDISTSSQNYSMRKVQSPDLIRTNALRSLDPAATSVVFGIADADPSANTFVKYVFRKGDAAKAGSGARAAADDDRGRGAAR